MLNTQGVTMKYIVGIALILFLSGCGGGSSESDEKSNIDTTAPTVTLNGASTIKLMVGDTYNEDGANAHDDVDGVLNPTIQGSVNTTVVGTYTITYTATDIAGNTATETRIIIVSNPLDNIAPVVTLIGKNSIQLTVGQTYIEQGATAVDNVDGNLSVTISGSVDNNAFGSYTITYTAIDMAGNIGTATRTVTVKEVILDTQAPVITLMGESSMTLNHNDQYIEAGATAIDNIDDNVSLTVSGSVDTTTVGTYIITYSATDLAGNKAENKLRTVVVVSPSECEDKYSEALMQGREAYNRTCASCHATDGKSGFLDIRNSTVADIEYALAEETTMLSVGVADQVTDAEVPLISLYLIELKKDSQVEFGNQCDDTQSVTRESLGNRFFFDANLSLRKTMSCSTCHNPTNAFMDARFKNENTTNTVHGALSVGDDDVTLGGRNTPTVMYAQFSPIFSQNINGEYFGGQFHDGRAATLKEQAKGPFLDQAEMMMPTAASVVERVMENSEYVKEMKRIYGENIFDNTDTAYDAIAESIAAFEKTDIFAPFSSKYDRSKLNSSDENYYAMTEQELQGYKIFFDTNKTNCVLCHSINSQSEGSKEVFTNFKYENIGTPKNLEAQIARDGNSDKIDLQLGGRLDINDSTLWGRTKVPTLRNVAITGPYMSNGVFKELRTILEFYNHMSGSAEGTLNPETGVPWEMAEVNTTINHELLKMERLSEKEMNALEAFLKLLTDKEYEALLP